MKLERKIRPWIGPLIVGLLIWRALPAVGGPELVPGPTDPRGFSAARVHEETGEPVRYNACQPLHYVVNPDLAPDGAVDDIHTAFEMTAEASGLRFVYDGETDEIATDDRPTYQPERYGERWAPILISWANDLPEPAAGPEGAKTIGWGGSTAEPNSKGEAVLVSGAATFDATATEIPAGFGGQTWGQAMLHELGHVLGLGHDVAGDSVMNPVIGLRSAVWGPGDRTGLWVLGLGSPCVESPQLP